MRQHKLGISHEREVAVISSHLNLPKGLSHCAIPFLTQEKGYRWPCEKSALMLLRKPFSHSKLDMKPDRPALRRRRRQGNPVQG